MHCANCSPEHEIKKRLLESLLLHQEGVGRKWIRGLGTSWSCGSFFLPLTSIEVVDKAGSWAGHIIWSLGCCYGTASETKPKILLPFEGYLVSVWRSTHITEMSPCWLQSLIGLAKTGKKYAE